MNSKTFIVLILFLLYVFMGCVTPQENMQGPISSTPSRSTVSLEQAIRDLSQRLASHPLLNEAGTIGIGDITGPGAGITPLGKYIQDKLFVHLSQLDAVERIVESDRIKKIMASKNAEIPDNFDQDTIADVGKLGGVDSLLVGTLKNLGSAFDLTVKMVRTATGQVITVSNINIEKDAQVTSLLGADSLSEVTVVVIPMVDGIVKIGSQQASLKHGRATFSGIPYGPNSITVQPNGHEPINITVMVGASSENVPIYLSHHNLELSFQIFPKEALLNVDGKRVTLNDNGFVKLYGLGAGKYGYRVNADGYEEESGTIDLMESSSITLNLRKRNVKRFDLSVWVIPPHAELYLDGRQVALRPQGYIRLSNLESKTYSCVARAKGYEEQTQSIPLSKDTTITIKLESNDPFYALKNELYRKVHEAGTRREFGLHIWSEKEVYGIGESIAFYFQSERDCYVNLIDIMSNGAIRLLFPNRYHSDNYIRAGVVYRVPDHWYGFDFIVEPPKGSDRVCVVAGAKPLALFEYDFVEEDFHTLSRTNTLGAKVKEIRERIDFADIRAADMLHIRIE